MSDSSPLCSPPVPEREFRVGSEVFLPHLVSISDSAQESPAIFRLIHNRGNQFTVFHAESGKSFPLRQFLGGMPSECDLIVAVRISPDFGPGFYIRHVARDSSSALIEERFESPNMPSVHHIYRRKGKAQEICAYKNKESRALFRILSGEELHGFLNGNREEGIKPPVRPFEDLEGVWKWIHDNPAHIFDVLAGE